MKRLGKWYEIWIDVTLSRPCLLIVTDDLTKPPRIVVLDPTDETKLVHCADDYDAVKLWLLEKEYKLVTWTPFER